ncbi:PilZ domain-containing protein [Oceanicoccus sagamiensis]|uniref:Cyclic diguanosine monophosphate-binding protein n=1 Tax=Oceanicoccus sagamiensis TaxID=716816 RepID=A0A1X9NEU2_9GAMM|nr:PilZ domain-containing protein [Oceanicoccus sagamiensis]ARN74405.1 PilZ domain-containing protein [Oceanicoccus sagamiensis]
MTNDIERRVFSRIAFTGEITLSQGDQEWIATLADLSLKGLLIVTPDNWNADTSQLIEATINLDEETSITMSLNWRHTRHGQSGFECEHIDIDSIIHLRRLVELNLGDEHLLERELTSLGG